MHDVHISLLFRARLKFVHIVRCFFPMRLGYIENTIMVSFHINDIFFHICYSADLVYIVCVSVRAREIFHLVTISISIIVQPVTKCFNKNRFAQDHRRRIYIAYVEKKITAEQILPFMPHWPRK